MPKNKSRNKQSEGVGFWDVVIGATALAGTVAVGAAAADAIAEAASNERRRQELDRLRRPRTVVIEQPVRTVLVNDNQSLLVQSLTDAYKQLDEETSYLRRSELESRIRRLERALGMR